LGTVRKVDLYPTLVNLTGFPLPSSENLEGISMAKVFDDPNNSKTPLKTAAYSQFPRCPCVLNETTGLCPDSTPQWENPCLVTPAANFTYMGYSIRTDQFRYNEWRFWNGEKLESDWSEEGLAGRELYDHTGDKGDNFDKYENVNIVDNPEYKEVVQQHHQLLVKHFHPRDNLRSEE